MFEKGNSSNRQKINGLSIQQVLRQNLKNFFVLTQENAFS